MPGANEHIVSSYEDELNFLAQSISQMGGTVEMAIVSATDALMRGDHEMALAVVAADRRVDELQTRIDEMAVSMIARRQPMALDLRQIVSSIHLSNDLERIGDMAKSISKRTLEMDGSRLSKSLFSGIRHMSEMALQLLKDALDAFAARDPEAAIAVCTRDAELDALYGAVFREFLTYMMEDPRNITQCTHLLFCAKNLERVGDHATNIAEAAYYMVTGRMLAQHATATPTLADQTDDD